MEPGEDDITQELKSVQRPKVDEDALQKIQDLQDQNVTVKTLFKNTRNNPFKE
jgi:hypothetical protein